MPQRYDPTIHHRHTIRLAGFDYAQAHGAFVTICTHDRNPEFGIVTDGVVELSPAGIIVEEELVRTAAVRVNPPVIPGAYVVMPNHVQAVFFLLDGTQGLDAGGGRMQYAPTDLASDKVVRSPRQTVGAIVRGLKAATTSRINMLRGSPGAPVWQRNYYEHITRSPEDMDRILRYIEQNPARWAEDEENPDRRP